VEAAPVPSRKSEGIRAKSTSLGASGRGQLPATGHCTDQTKAASPAVCRDIVAARATAAEWIRPCSSEDALPPSPADRRLPFSTRVAIVASGSAIAAFTSACVPDVAFEQADAAAMKDAVAETVIDAGRRDAASDASVSDVAVASDGGCPGSPPDGATACCGGIACAGDCDDAGCATCFDKCSATQLCCARGQSITCHAMGANCQ
jgi:hypothetical protein